MKNDFAIYSIGLCFMSVCASKDLTQKDIMEKANLEHPTGISHAWNIHTDNFKDGSPNPCPCNQKPETNQHFLLSC